MIQAVAALQIALQHNPQSTEVSRKIKRLMQVAKEHTRTLELESMRSNIDMRKYLDPFKNELVSESHLSVLPYSIDVGNAVFCSNIY